MQLPQLRKPPPSRAGSDSATSFADTTLSAAVKFEVRDASTANLDLGKESTILKIA